MQTKRVYEQEGYHQTCVQEIFLASPPVEDILHICAFLSRQLHKCKICVMTEEKEKMHSFGLYPKRKICPLNLEVKGYPQSKGCWQLPSLLEYGM